MGCGGLILYVMEYILFFCFQTKCGLLYTVCRKDLALFCHPQKLHMTLRHLKRNMCYTLLNTTMEVDEVCPWQNSVSFKRSEKILFPTAGQ